MPITIPGAERSSVLFSKRFGKSRCVTPASMRTIDPVIFRDVGADVVLVRGRPQGARECGVFAQEVGRRAGVEVLIWNSNHNMGTAAPLTAFKPQK